MGEVYRARDTRLERIVAIKLMRQEVASQSDFRQRFEREARLTSALNHPHICTLHDVGTHDGFAYLVMEYVEGETLETRLHKGRLAIESVLRFGGQIAEALAAAHARGIIHRDLKPGNIMITKAGVKVLDFGLAKLTRPTDAVGTSVSISTATASQQILGTVPYMAPEQLEGKAGDTRTDIFALGLVLYEMATGKRAFTARNHSTLVAEIIRCEPTSMGAVPEKFSHTVERCLARDPDDRWQSAKDVKLELEWTANSAAAPALAVGKTSARRIWGVATVAGALLLLAAIVMWQRLPRSELPVRLSLSFEGLVAEAGHTPLPSPDGKNFAFLAFDASGKRSLWIRPLNLQTARQMAGTLDAEQPFWSADGRSIGFYAQGKLKKVSISGGGVQTITEIADIARGLANIAAWNGNGDIIWVLNNRSPLFRIRESSGVIEQLTSLDSNRAENSHRYPVFLPNGRDFLFVARSGQRENNALFLGSLDSGETRRLMRVQSNVSYVPPRHGRHGALLYVRDGNLVAQGFDGRNLTSEPATVVENVDYTAPSIWAAFAVSSDGSVLIFRPAGAGRTQFAWFDRMGNARGALGPPGDYTQPRISSDGSRVLFSRPDQDTGNRDIWYLETSRGSAARLTTDPANDWWPVWSPDDRSVAFASDRGRGRTHVPYLKNSLEAGRGETPFFSNPEAYVTDWSRDGRWIALVRGGVASVDDIWVRSASTGQSPFAFLDTPFVESLPRFSPDSKWIAYVSNESGRDEVYARTFSGGPAAAGEKILISSNGADYPVWQRDGKELFFIGGDLKLYSVKTADFRRGAALQPSILFTPCESTALAGLPMRATPWSFPYDVSPDGERFLVNCSTLAPGRFDVLLNWAAADQ
jgi:Tol biopolymer transport system component/tRNA A-37 threonylcarbamoyl transferase component Bud32